MDLANFKAFVASMDEKYVYVFVASVCGVVLVLLAAFLKKVITDRRKKIRGSIMVKENDQMVRRSTREVRRATKFQVEAPEEPFTPPPSTRKSRSTSKKAPATPKTPATTSKATPKTAGGSRKARSTTKASGRASRSPSPAITRSARKKKQ